MMNKVLVNVATAEPGPARRPPPDPPLPAGLMWQNTKMGGMYEGRYLARASILDWCRNWNNGRVIRFDTEAEAKHEQKSLHLEDSTLIEKTYVISGRRGHGLKHQYIIRLTYCL